MACIFNWGHLYDSQFTSFAGNAACVAEIADGHESAEYASDEIKKRGLGDSIRFNSYAHEWAESAAGRYRDGECSFVFIDSHDYETTVRGLRAWYRTVHYNSAIAGHGADDSEVMRAVREFFGEKDLPVRTHGGIWMCNHCHKPKELW